MLKHSIIAQTSITNYNLALLSTERDYVIARDYHPESGVWEQGIYYPKVSCEFDYVIKEYGKEVAEQLYIQG